MPSPKLRINIIFTVDGFKSLPFHCKVCVAQAFFMGGI